MNRPTCLPPVGRRPQCLRLLPERFRRLPKGLAWLMLPFLLGAAPLEAQDSPPEVLPEVLVTAARAGSPLVNAPAFVTVITAKQIEDSPAASLPELLRSKGGLDVSSYGPTGTLSTVSIRGSTSSQVLVLLNGVPLNSALSSSVDLSQIPTNMIERIEVVQGGESSVYGSDAIGGVIDITTKGAAGRRSTFSAKIENGSYIPHSAEAVSPAGTQTPVAANPLNLVDTQRASLSGATHLGPVGISAGGGFTRAANGYVWYDASGIGNWRQEGAAAGTSGDGFVSLAAPLGSGRFTASGSARSSSYDVPGPLSFPQPGYQQTTSAQGSLGYSLRATGERRLGVSSKLYYQYSGVDYTNAYYPAYDSTSRTNSAGGELTTTYRFSDGAALLAGASARYDGVDSSDIGAPRSRINLAGVLAAPLAPGARLTLTPTLRYDYFSDAPSGLSYRLGAVYALGAHSALKGSIGESYRVPSIYDLYLPAGPNGVGNPALKPETAYAGEFGYSLEGERASVDAALFTRFVENQIVWVATSTSYVPENLGRSLLPGVQLEGRARLLGGLALSLNDSFIYSFLLADQSASYSFAENRRVPYVPLNTLTGTLSYGYRGASLALEGQYVTAEQTELGSTVAPHVVLNLSYRQAIAKGVSLSLVAKNLLNTTYETSAGYNMPPFSLWTGLEISR